MKDLQTITARALAERFHEIHEQVSRKYVAGKHQLVSWHKLDNDKKRMLIDAFQQILDELRQGWVR